MPLSRANRHEILQKALSAVTLMLILLSAGGIDRAALAADSDAFQKALHAQNRAHLDAVWPLQPHVTSSMIDSALANHPDTGPWELRHGPVKIVIDTKRTTPVDLAPFARPVLTVAVEGETVITVEGTESAPDFVSFIAQIVEMDPGNPHPEIIFSSYTGGAHCCSDTRVITSSQDGNTWREIEAGWFDGAPLAATDLDGDGRFELAMRDNRFLYAFGCYACSGAPLYVLRLEDGRMIDASALPAYRPAHQTHMAALVLSYRGGGEGSNGFLAGYVGQKIRLGEGRQAWDFMTANHDRKSDWGLDVCSVKLDANQKCPGRTERLTFPDALKRFLEEAGYPLPE